MNATILCIVGARPNFIKMAPILRAMKQHPQLKLLLLHTGQHYDDKLSSVFFRDLSIPKPDISLDVGSGSHGWQTSEIIQKIEPILERTQPHAVLVVGDVNSTVACALTAAKFSLKNPFDSKIEQGRKRPIIVHVEAGLRSNDRNMPEEINRLVTDSISDLLFVTEPSGEKNLLEEGVDPARIHFVGNVMIDTLLAARTLANESSVLSDLGISSKSYGLVTLHRPSNVDFPTKLESLLRVLDNIAKEIPLIFAVHPRTRGRISDLGITLDTARWTLCPPLGYLDFLHLMGNAQLVCSDSGGIQEETTILKVPCLTLRDNTERPITITHGTNRLAGTTEDSIWKAFTEFRHASPRASCPPLWDGRSADRIATVIANTFS